MARHSPRGLIALALAVGTPGCAQIAGIEETSAPQDNLTLTVDRVSIGTSVVASPQELSPHMATYLVPDDEAVDGLARIPAELIDTNVWAASVAGQAPAIMFSLPDEPTPRVRILDLGQRNLRATLPVYEHPAPTPAPADATLTVEVTLPSAFVTGESFQFYSVGTWAARTFPAAELPEPDLEITTLGPVTFAYEATSTQTGRPHEAITPADAVLVLRYHAGLLTGVMEAAPFEQTGADSITGTMTAVGADQMLSVQLEPSSVASRYAPLRPAMGTPSMSWNLVAAPGAETADTLGPSLRTSVSIPASDSGEIALAYGNPFESKGWPAVFSWTTAASRTFTPAGQTLPVTLQARLTTRALPAPPNDSNEPQRVELAAGLPELILLDGTPLSTDGLEIARPTRAVQIEVVASGASTVYGVELYELVPNMAGTALEHRFVVSSLGVTPTLVLPPEMFEPGSIYTLRALTVAGSYPELAAGDLSVRSLPHSLAYHDSGVFTVLP